MIPPAVVSWCRTSLLPPPVLAESVRDAVGRRVKLTLRRRVQLEVKGDKVENRVLVSSVRIRPCQRWSLLY